MSESGRVPSTARAIASAPKSLVVGYWRGLTYPFKGARFVYLQHPGLVRYWILPILITLLAIAGMLYGVYQLHDDVVGWIWDEPSGDGFWAGVVRFFHGALEILVAIGMLLLGFVAVVFLTSAIAAPFNDLLSEEVERIVTGQGGPPFRLSATIRGILRTIVIASVFGVTSLVLELGSCCLPAIGQAICSALLFVIGAISFSVDFLDYPSGRRDEGLGRQLGRVRRHFLAMFGFGTGVWLFLFVPIVNLLFMPAAVAGGTLLYLDLRSEEAAGLSPPDLNATGSPPVPTKP